MLSVTVDSLRVDTFNIVSLIPEFSKDSNLHSISGIKVGTDIQKSVIYNIYRLPKKRVFDILKTKSRDSKLSGKRQI